MTQSLYQDDIKALAKREMATQELVNPDCAITLDNPLCGDRVTMALQLEGDRIVAESHQVKGCLLCRASANAIAESVVGRSRDELPRVATALHAMLKGEAPENWPLPGWESLQVFQPVTDHKSRHDCVMLPFKALDKALGQA